LPAELILSMLKCFAGASRSRSNQASECVRIIGLSRAATLANRDTKLLRQLQSIFAGKPDADHFRISDEDEFNIPGEVDGAVKADLAKAEEVERMQAQHQAKWPNLLSRFQKGVASVEPDVVLNLVLETVDYILTPIRKMNRTRHIREVDLDGDEVDLLARLALSHMMCQSSSWWVLPELGNQWYAIGWREAPLRKSQIMMKTVMRRVPDCRCTIHNLPWGMTNSIRRHLLQM